MSNKIKYKGKLNLRDKKISCYVIEDKTRMLAEKDVIPFSNFVQLASHRPFKNFIVNIMESEDMKPVDCYEGSELIRCYKATAIVDAWSILCDMEKSGEISEELSEISRELTDIVCGLARFGLSAVVDEVTGNTRDAPLK